MTNVDVEFFLQFVLAYFILFSPSINFNLIHASGLDSIEDKKRRYFSKERFEFPQAASFSFKIPTHHLQYSSP